MLAPGPARGKEIVGFHPDRPMSSRAVESNHFICVLRSFSQKSSCCGGSSSGTKISGQYLLCLGWFGIWDGLGSVSYLLLGIGTIKEDWLIRSHTSDPPSFSDAWESNWWSTAGDSRSLAHHLQLIRCGTFFGSEYFLSESLCSVIPKETSFVPTLRSVAFQNQTSNAKPTSNFHKSRPTSWCDAATEEVNWSLCTWVGTSDSAFDQRARRVAWVFKKRSFGALAFWTLGL